MLNLLRFYLNLILLTFFTLHLLSSPVLAEGINDGFECNPKVDYCNDPKDSCQLRPSTNRYFCYFDNTKASFGTIKPPPELFPFTSPDPTGRYGISAFLSNLVKLIYSLATIVLIFMILWGAWDWMTSEGDKEKLESAKKKLLNALVGIMLFAVAFAIIQIIGKFTGFTFFVGQK